MSVDYSGALDMMLPTHYSFDSITPLAIVCHKTGGDAHIENVYNTFMATMRSTHFAVDTDGRIAQFVPLSRGAGGNCCPDKAPNGKLICDPFWFPLASKYKNLNFCTISIEHCDPTNDNSHPMPQAQIDASNALVKWLCDLYHINTDHILGHNSINPVQKPLCPGPTFNFVQLANYVNSGGTTVLNANFQKEADLCWESTAHLFPNATSPNKGTKIYSSWIAAWLKGHQFGPPLTGEYDSLKADGTTITCQEFAHARCEYVLASGMASWYGSTGSIKF
jgi:hypothetical protein